MSFFSRLVGVFISPGESFKSIKEKPGWVLPLIVSIALTYGFLFKVMPVLQAETRTRQVEAMEKRGMNSDQIEQAMERAGKITKISMLVGAGVGPIFGFFIGTAIWMLVANVVLGGTAKFWSMLSTNIYRSFILTLGALIKLPLILSKKTMNVHFSPATFMSDASDKTFLYKFLAQLDLFTIWSVAVLCIGIAVVSGQETKKVAPWVVVVYVLYFAVSALLGGMFG